MMQCIHLTKPFAPRPAKPPSSLTTFLTINDHIHNLHWDIRHIKPNTNTKLKFKIQIKGEDSEFLPA